MPRSSGAIATRITYSTLFRSQRNTTGIPAIIIPGILTALPVAPAIAAAVLAAVSVAIRSAYCFQPSSCLCTRTGRRRLLPASPPAIPEAMVASMLISDVPVHSGYRYDHRSSYQ